MTNYKSNPTLLEATRKVETVLKSTQNKHIDISGNIMVGRRVFSMTRKGNPELLVLLSNKIHNVGYPQVWGHIFKDPEKGIYIAAIVNIARWFESLDISSTFDEFWYYIGEAGAWSPAKGEACAFGINFQEAADELCRLIESLSQDEEAENDIRLVSLYPFPNPLKERRYFDRWLKEERRNV